MAERSPWKRARRLAAVAAITAIVAIQLALVLYGSKHSKSSSPAGSSASGGPAPELSARGVLNGQPLTSARLRGSNVLLFFGKGVACRACLEEIRSLQRDARELRLRGVLAVDITTDPAEVLRQAALRYHITTPAISDAGGAMSSAYGLTGQSTRSHAGGHAFVLIDRAGRVRWRHEYPMAYVPPDQLLTAISWID